MTKFVKTIKNISIDENTTQKCKRTKRIKD